MQRRLAQARTLHVWLGALGVAAFYTPFAAHSPGPILYSDSMEYLGTARTLVGAGQPVNFDYSAATASGYSLLLAPAYAVTTDPHAVFVYAMVLNVLLGASIFVGAYLLARDAFRLDHRWSLLAGAVAAVYPGYLLQTGQVWPEVLLAAEVLWWLVLLARFLDGGRLVTAAAFGILTGFTWTTHRRMVAVVVTTLILLAFVAWRRRDRRAGAVLAAALAALVIGLTHVLEHWLRDKLFTIPPVNEGVSGTLLSGLAPRHWGTVALEALGEVWYLGVGSLCLVLLGALGLSRLAWERRERLLDCDTRALVALSALVATLGTVLVGALSLYKHPTIRVDLLVYGRYVEEFSGAMLVAATALLVATRPATRRTAALLLSPAAFLVVLTAVLYGIRGGSEFTGSVQKLTVPALLGEQVLFQGRTVFTGAIHIRALAVLAVFMFCVLLVLRRFSAAKALGAAAIAFAFFAVIGETQSLHLFARHWNAVYRCAPTAIEAQYGDSGTLSVSVYGIDPEARNRYQYLLPGYRVTYFDGVRAEPSSPLVIAPRNWPEAASLHFTPVTGEIYGDEALWVSPSAPRPQPPPVLPDGTRCPAA